MAVKKSNKKTTVKVLKNSKAISPKKSTAVSKPTITSAKKAVGKTLKTIAKIAEDKVSKKIAVTKKVTKVQVTKSTPKKATTAKTVIQKKESAKAISKNNVIINSSKSKTSTGQKENTNKKLKTTTNITETKNKTEKATKFNHGYVKFEMEFPMHTSRNSLFTFLTDASSLSSWFADHVDVINNDDYIFTWDGSSQTAKVVGWKESQMVRYHWLHEPDGTYFEFSIVEDELTFDIALLVTDFAEDQQSVEASKRLWQSQIDDLHHAIGG